VTLPTENWIVAGFDLTVCAIGAALLHAAWKVSRHQGRNTRQPAPASNQAEEETE
jgi:hypothetical protein